MLLIAIIGAEIAFWILLLGGLAVRYLLHAPRTGAVLLISTPLVDLVLLVLTYIDLSGGGSSHFLHGLSAFYIGFTVVFGPIVIRVLDQKASRKFHNTGTHEDKGSSVEEQDKLWIKCCIASGITSILLIAGILVVGLSGAFWLIYWLISISSTVVVWWFIGPWLARRRAKRKESEEFKDPSQT